MTELSSPQPAPGKGVDEAPSAAALTLRAIDKTILPLAKRFYQHAGYRCRFDRQSAVWALAHPDTRELLACVQLDRITEGEHEELGFLRAMVVHPAHRRCGIGTQLLSAIAPQLNTRRFWCFPFTPLHDLYASAGFMQKEPEALPAVLAQRYARYRAQGKDLLAMVRAPQN